MWRAALLQAGGEVHARSKGQGRHRCVLLALHPPLPLGRPATPEEPEAGEGQAGPSSGSGRRKRRLAADGGSPMDVCPTPFTGKQAGRLHRRCGAASSYHLGSAA